MKTVEEVKQIWSDVIQNLSLQVEYVPLDAAYGRILAENMMTPVPIPNFNKSAFDGYAICSISENDNSPLSDTYHLVAHLGAGELYKGELTSGEAVRIMTGAPVPKGADTVVMQEQCSVDKDMLTIVGNYKRGSNIIAIGADCPANTLMVSKGSLLKAAQIAVLAGIGVNSVPVYKNPRVLVITAGREVVMPYEHALEGQIYNSNLYMLKGLIQEMGIDSIETYHMTDDPACVDQEIMYLKDLVKREQFDVVISTGGVSVGDYDFMPDVYEALGAEKLYNRLQMRPGAATYGGYNKEKHIFFFGLSGNPTAAYNCFQLIAKPALRLLQGYHKRDMDIESFTCKVGRELSKNTPMDRYIQGVVQVENNSLVFYPNDVFMASSLTSIANVRALGIMRAGVYEIHVGDSIEVILC